MVKNKLLFNKQLLSYIMVGLKAELFYDVIVYGIFATPAGSESISKGESLWVLMPYGFHLTQTQLSLKLNLLLILLFNNFYIRNNCIHL
jgi:hypothetical protein